MLEDKSMVEKLESSTFLNRAINVSKIGEVPLFYNNFEIEDATIDYGSNDLSKSVDTEKHDQVVCNLAEEGVLSIRAISPYQLMLLKDKEGNLIPTINPKKVRKLKLMD